LPEGAIDRVFDALDIPKHREGEYSVISPKNYSSILRSLYLSSYLRREDSNGILDILTQTKFNDKLPAGVPGKVLVAHKIGVFDENDAGQPVFSDCGIVYQPDRPYVLCIMVKADEATARQHIQLLSKMVYGYVSQVKENRQ
jgi:beta-lactamase class A